MSVRVTAGESTSTKYVDARSTIWRLPHLGHTILKKAGNSGFCEEYRSPARIKKMRSRQPPLEQSTATKTLNPLWGRGLQDEVAQLLFTIHQVPERRSRLKVDRQIRRGECSQAPALFPFNTYPVASAVTSHTASGDLSQRRRVDSQQAQVYSS